MTRKRTNYKPKSFESLGEKYIDPNGKTRTDTSANIFESMLTSNAFTELTFKQQVLYIYCKAQYYGKRKPSKDYPNVSDVQSPECFYFNWATAQRYKLYPAGSSKNFYSDMTRLIEHGLIEKIASGAAHRTKTIYRFSSEWQRWKK